MYGADAVAGVVNIITRQQFTGGAINATGGTSYKNDDNEYRGSLTLGSGDLTKDKYNAYITFDGQHQSASPRSTRDEVMSAALISRITAMPMSTSARARWATAITQ